MLKLNNSDKYNFTLDRRSFVLVKLVNIIGIDIATLVSEERLPGSYEVKFDKKKCPAGIYYYKLFTEATAENSHDSVTFPEHSNKKLLLIDTKEVLML
jgi:hypothetical protein